MVLVTWYGAVAYCNWRSQREGYEKVYDPCDPNRPCDFSKHGYRLPTEAEWEYAARGGEQNPYFRFPWGDTISHSQANYYSYWEDGSPYYPYDVSPTEGFHPVWNDGTKPYTSPVGSFSPNGYGLYDMSGNVWEWCNDWYDTNYYYTSPYDSPEGPASGIYRVLRSGSWQFWKLDWRVASRGNRDPTYRFSDYGIRIVLDLE
jgi:formylglycine-generating enzyme required for sulfatase activity